MCKEESQSLCESRKHLQKLEVAAASFLPFGSAFPGMEVTPLSALQQEEKKKIPTPEIAVLSCSM